LQANPVAHRILIYVITAQSDALHVIVLVYLSKLRHRLSMDLRLVVTISFRHFIDVMI